MENKREELLESLIEEVEKHNKSYVIMIENDDEESIQDRINATPEFLASSALEALNVIFKKIEEDNEEELSHDGKLKLVDTLLKIQFDNN